MITLDAIRAALQAPNPYDQMDHLVRAELAAGRKVKDVFNTINPLVDAALETPGLTEDGEEAFLGTLDALTGNCRADQCYQDPPNTALPTEDEIATLPRWAQVAFAARCARRVLPLFLQKWPDAPDDHRARLSWAVEIGERSAARAGVGDDWAPPAGAITCAAYVCDAVINADRNRGRAIEVIMATGVAVAKFKDKAENIFNRHIGAIFHVVTNNTAVAIANAIAGSREGYAAAKVVADMTIRRDFDHLCQSPTRQKWTDDTPVAPELFGPLWPDGPPKGWPAITDSPHSENPLTLFLPGLVLAAG